MSDLLKNLNKQQRVAVEYTDGSMLIIAGAGTGKTKVIATKIAHLVLDKKISPLAILTLSFNEKAVQEIAERIDILLPLSHAEAPISTFHAFGDQLLRTYGLEIGLDPSYEILDKTGSWLFMREHLFDFDLSYFRPAADPLSFINDLLGHFDSLRHQNITPKQYLDFAEKFEHEDEEEVLKTNELARAYQQFMDLKIEKGVMDFADLQYYAWQLLQKRPNILKKLQNEYQYVLVDEFQDTNLVQNLLAQQIAEKHQRITVCGDDDQSIYKFRGAAVQNILQFEQDFPNCKKVVLKENYRSTQDILDHAYQLITSNNPDRLEVKANVDKKLTSNIDEDGEIAVIHTKTSEEEAAVVVEKMQETKEKHGLDWRDFAILGRSHRYLEEFAAEMYRQGIPHFFVGMRGFYLRREITDLTNLLRTIKTPFNDVSLDHVLRLPMWMISMLSLIALRDEARQTHSPLWQVANLVTEDKGFLPQIADDDREKIQQVLAKINEYIEMSRQQGAGDILYQFLRHDGYLQYIQQSEEMEASEQIQNVAKLFNQIKKFEGRSPSQTLQAFVDYLDLVQEAGEDPRAAELQEDFDAVSLTTVHGAKGLEFTCVFIVNAATRRFPSDYRAERIPLPEGLAEGSLDPKESHIQEERRLFYVAMTRAKRFLYISHSDFYGDSRSRVTKPSRFLLETGLQSPEKELVEADEDDLFLPTQKEAIKASFDHQVSKIDYTRVKTFEDCPLKYYYRYVQKVPGMPSDSMRLGNLVHGVISRFWQEIKKQKEDLAIKEVNGEINLDFLLNTYKQMWPNRGGLHKKHLGELYEEGKKMLENFWADYQKSPADPRLIEENFYIKVGDYTLKGRFDLVEDLGDGKCAIVDYKTGKAKEKKEVEKDPQLAIYAMGAMEAFDLVPERLIYYFLKDNKKEEVTKSQKDLDKVKAEIEAIIKEINVSDFAPTGNDWNCRWCEYRDFCPKKRPHSGQI